MDHVRCVHFRRVPALFYMRGVAPKEIPTSTIFLAALPFLGLQTLGLFLCILFPEIALYLPRLAFAAPK